MSSRPGGAAAREDCVESFGDFGERRIEAGTAANGVDRFEPAGGDEPRAGIVRHAFFGPLFHGRGERVVQRFLGQVEIAEQANQRGEHAARVGAVNGVDCFADVVEGGGRHSDIVSDTDWQRSRSSWVSRRVGICPQMAQMNADY